MSSKTVKLSTSSFIFIWMSSIVFVQVAVGVPLPFRESQTIPSYQSPKPLEPHPPLGSRNFQHAHPHTHTYQGSMSTSHHHFHEKGFSGSPTAVPVPGRPKRHNNNEGQFSQQLSNDHLNHQNPYPHLNHYQHHDIVRHDHQSLDNNNFHFQHHSMPHYYQHQQKNQEQQVHPNHVHHDSRAQHFHQPVQTHHHHHQQHHRSGEDPEFHEFSNEHLFRQKRDVNAPHTFDSDWEPDQNGNSAGAGSSKLYPQFNSMNGYCTTLDCFEKSAWNNNIRQAESSTNNKPVYDEVKVQGPDAIHPSNSNNIRRRPNNNPPRVVQISPDQRHQTIYSSSRASNNGDDRNSKSNNKIPLPSQILVPPQQQAVPLEEPQGWSWYAGDESWNHERDLNKNFLQQQQNNDDISTEDFGQFYGQYPYNSLQQPPANYLDFPHVLSIPQYNGQYEINPRDSLPLDNSWNDFNSFFSTSTPPVPPPPPASSSSSSSGEDASLKTPPDAIRMRASGISIGPDGGVQIVKVILNFSNEDDEETQLEVDADQY